MSNFLRCSFLGWGYPMWLSFRILDDTDYLSCLHLCPKPFNQQIPWQCAEHLFLFEHEMAWEKRPLVENRHLPSFFTSPSQVKWATSLSFDIRRYIVCLQTMTVWIQNTKESLLGAVWQFCSAFSHLHTWCLQKFAMEMGMQSLLRLAMESTAWWTFQLKLGRLWMPHHICHIMSKCSALALVEQFLAVVH